MLCLCNQILTNINNYSTGSSPYTVNSNTITDSGVNFIVIAQDWRDNVYARVLHIAPPTPPPPSGPVMIGIVNVDPPDPFGRVVIHFNTSDPAATCRCRVNQTVHPCPWKFSADPRELGEGIQNITISCVDTMGYIDTKNIRLSLIMPPTPRKFHPSSVFRTLCPSLIKSVPLSLSLSLSLPPPLPTIPLTFFPSLFPPFLLYVHQLHVLL